MGPTGLSESLENQPTQNFSGTLNNFYVEQTMELQLDGNRVDELILRELIVEMNSGDFWLNAPDDELREMLEILWVRLKSSANTRSVMIATA